MDLFATEWSCFSMPSASGKSFDTDVDADADAMLAAWV